MCEQIGKRDEFSGKRWYEENAFVLYFVYFTRPHTLFLLYAQRCQNCCEVGCKSGKFAFQEENAAKRNGRRGFLVDLFCRLQVFLRSTSPRNIYEKSLTTFSAAQFKNLSNWKCCQILQIILTAAVTFQKRRKKTTKGNPKLHFLGFFTENSH